MPAPNKQSEMISDAETVVGSCEDPSRFAVIFDRHYDAIAAYLGRRVDRALADELASETFLRAFANRGSYDPVHIDARPWLYGIATNLLRKHARSDDRRRRAYARAVGVEAVDDGTDGTDGIVARAEARSRGPAVAAALARLQPADRDALLLLALTDLDYAGIAVATDVPIGTVRSRLHRARRHLRTALAVHDQASEDPPTERSRT
jgi:RNA polymerase sigma-70 factor (ECF subfamily)